MHGKMDSTFLVQGYIYLGCYLSLSLSIHPGARRQFVYLRQFTFLGASKLTASLIHAEFLLKVSHILLSVCGGAGLSLPFR